MIVPFVFEDPELAEALDRYHKAAAERARRIADQIDRSLLTMVNPITLKPTDVPFPDELTPILDGQYKNASESRIQS